MSTKYVAQVEIKILGVDDQKNGNPLETVDTAFGGFEIKYIPQDCIPYAMIPHQP